MPFDPAGNYSLPPSYKAVSGALVRVENHNPPLEDIAQALSNVLKRDGRDGMVGTLTMGGFPIRNMQDGADPADAATLGQVMAMIAAARVPVGMMAPLSGTQIPSGWVRANGQSLSRTTFSGLWAFAQASGNLAASEGVKTPGQYGPGNGSTTFTVPNLEADGGYFIRPVSSGRNVGTVQQADIGPHQHPVTGTTNTSGEHTHTVYRGASSGGSTAARDGGNSDSGPQSGSAGSHSHTVTGTALDNAGTETRPKNIAYPVIIKT